MSEIPTIADSDRFRLSALADIEPLQRTDADRRETPQEGAERRARVEDARIGRWEVQVPSRFRTAALDDLEDRQDPRHLIRGWWDSGHRTLVLTGVVTGVGKTHALYAAANHAVREHRAWAAAWFMPDLNEAMRPDGDADALTIACEAQVLAIDDLGRERITEWTLERLTMILDARSRGGVDRRLIVSTNLTGQQMIERYGDPIVDRILDDMVVVDIPGPSRRKPAPW